MGDLKDEDEWFHITAEDYSRQSTGLQVSRRSMYKLPFRLELTMTAGRISNASLSSTNVEIPIRVRSAQTQSRFCTLPPGLRLCIYEHLFRLSTPRQIVELHPQMRRSPARHPPILSILETCHFVLAEAERLFYAGTTIHIDLRCQIDGLRRYLESIGPRRRAAIKSMSLIVPSASVTLVALQQLPSATSLQYLHLERPLALQFMDISGWVLLATQFKSALRRFEHLAELEITTHDLAASDTTQDERRRLLKDIDLGLQAAVTERSV